MSRWIVFRCQSGEGVGLGHVMRCREMARHLRDQGILSAMIGPAEGLRLAEDSDLFQHWQAVEDRQGSARDAARVVALCDRLGTRHAVIDDYRADPAFQKVLKAGGLRWLQQFDASCDWRFCCDVLVNAGPLERRSAYLQRLERPERVQTLFGPAHAVLRRGFRQVVWRRDGRAVRRVLVAFGGGDDRGAIALVLKALAGREVTLVIVSGAGNPGRTVVERAVAEMGPGQVELHVGPEDMPGLMAGCDLAVIGGGTMSYEAAICGLPMVTLALAANQERPCLGWQALTGAPYLGRIADVGPEALFEAVSSLIRADSQREAMAVKGRQAVDGRGVERLISALLERAVA
ncbi:PseG/SpsG family protein [Roseovarius sp.]|jgi:spore coat polysaccharide biosynthesis predicted glycosyltransferase SpsG